MQEILISYDQTKSMYDTARDLNIHPHKVWRVLKKNGITLRTPTETKNKISIDEKFFETIDSQNKAYFLGLIYSDGNVHGNTCRISLVEEDTYILEELLKLISPERKLHYKKGRLMSNGNTSKPQMALSFTNKKIIKDLKLLGVYPAKSLTLSFPTFDQVPLNLMPHFIRGYFDGDGCIYNIKSAYRMSFIGSHDFCRVLNILLENHNIMSMLIVEEKISRICISDKSQIINIFNFMYVTHGAQIKLERKYNKFKEMINTTNWDNIGRTKYSNVSGVSFDKRRNRWVAVKKKKGKANWLGSFLTEKEAIQAIEKFNNQSFV